MEQVDVVIIGAGAAGLMCAIEAGKRGRRVVVLEHARKPGNKIRMSGGGRCNFTNYHVTAENYLCRNPHFVKSALSRYTQWDFIALVDRHHIAWEEREHGQLFCTHSARDILDMLLREATAAGVRVRTKAAISGVVRASSGFRVVSDQGVLGCEALVVATGGLSIPSMGASPFGYQLAEQFGLTVHPPRAGLVPFTLQPGDKARLATLAGVSAEARVRCGGHSFREHVLFTHRGLSGPAILQISSHWSPGEWIEIDWLPGQEAVELMQTMQREHPDTQVKTALARHLPMRLVALLLDGDAVQQRRLRSLQRSELERLSDTLHRWRIRPGGTEGYRTAEVTLGGVDCDAVSSKTFEAPAVPGLYFIGEVLDVAGWLGGYNFQWAWASGWCAGQYV